MSHWWRKESREGNERTKAASHREQKKNKEPQLLLLPRLLPCIYASVLVHSRLPATLIRTFWLRCTCLTLMSSVRSCIGKTSSCINRPEFCLKSVSNFVLFLQTILDASAGCPQSSMLCFGRHGNQAGNYKVKHRWLARVSWRDEPKLWVPCWPLFHLFSPCLSPIVEEWKASKRFDTFFIIFISHSVKWVVEFQRDAWGALQHTMQPPCIAFTRSVILLELHWLSAPFTVCNKVEGTGKRLPGPRRRVSEIN